MPFISPNNIVTKPRISPTLRHVSHPASHVPVLLPEPQAHHQLISQTRRIEIRKLAPLRRGIRKADTDLARQRPDERLDSPRYKCWRGIRREGGTR